jgi:hypothetical protein
MGIKIFLIKKLFIEKMVSFEIYNKYVIIKINVILKQE